MENKAKKVKLWHRIKYRSAVAPSVASNNLIQFAIELKRRHRVMLYMNKIVKKTKSEERGVKVAPLYHAASTDNDIREFCRSCPSTAMSRFQERNILRKVEARELELHYPVLLNNIMSEAKEEFLLVTQQSGIEMKLKSVEKQFQIQPYKYLGRTDNYPVFLQRRKELKSKFILHHPLIRRILNECVTKLPYELFNLNTSLKSELDTNEFQKHIFDYANDAAQRLQEFYRNIVVLVEHEKMNTQRARSYLGACTGLLSVNISRTIAHTLLHVVSFTGSKEHIPYLKLNITFKDRLILEPTAEDIIEIYNKFLKKIVDGARQFYVLEKYKIKGFDNKQIHLCLTVEFFQSILVQIARNIREKYEPILDYIKSLDDEFVDIYADLCSGGNTISTSDLIFEDGCKKLLYFKSYLPKVAFIPDNAYFTIGQLILTDYREILKQTLLNIIDNIFNNLSAQHEWENNDICEAFDIIYVRATQKPITTEEVIEIGKYMAWVRTEYLDELKERVIKALAYLTKLIQLGPLKENHIIINAKAINWLDKILPILEENITTYEQLKFEAEEKLQRVIEDINVDIKDVYPLLDILDLMDNIENVRHYLNTITLHMVKIKKIENKIEWINKEEVALSFPKSSYSEFDDLKNYVYPFYHLLKLSLDVQRNLSVWLDGQFDLINYERVKENVEKYYKELLRTQKVYRNKLRQAQDENLSLRFKGTVDDPDMLNWPAPLKLCSKAIKLIQDFEPSLAVIKIMCNEALMKRHWQKMSKVAGFDITPNAGTTLRKIIQIDLTPDIDKYEQISFSATKERELLENLQEMLQEWTHVNFKTGYQEEIKVIVALEDVEIVADDHIIKVINMLNSIYVKPYYNQVKDFYSKLLGITKTVQECSQAQQQWLHFLPLFLCEEITMQISAETKIFKQITDVYTNYIEMIHTEPNVYTTINNTNILQDLLNCNQQFELIKQGVNRYFDKIRCYFSRFYFVANEEMFRILSLTKDPTQIHRFIKSLFYEIRDLRFNENFAIVGIVSENNEILHLIQTVETQKFHGCVEMWLKELENEISASIRQMIQKAVKNHNQERWFLQWPCQISLVVAKIIFTLGGITAINNNTLDAFRTKIQDEMEHILGIIKSSDITNVQRWNLNSLVIIMCNNKDVVTRLITSGVKTDQDFSWLSQLRYYPSGDDCVVRIFDNCLEYRNEYIGNKKHIVLTPDTERCYHSLLLAYKYHLCANLQGSAGTGKTDTIKALAKAVAVHCPFFYCSYPVSFLVIFEFLKGAAANGCWLVLEDFNTIHVEACSVLSEQISRVSNALKSGHDTILLNSTDLPLRTCFISCTMKEESKFPENFRVLFRPIVMTVPDYQTITQVKLLSVGYRSWEDLGRRITTLHVFMSDLLDFSKVEYGMRPLKALLEECAKSVNSEGTEEQIIHLCVRKILMPKLSEPELSVFENLVSQIFTSEITRPSLKLQSDITLACGKFNLDANPNFVLKVEELHEAMGSNAGVIIVGPTLTGKTTLIRVLQAVCSGQIVVKTITPKTLTFKQLYGGIDDNTLHWCDGIINNSLSEFSEDVEWIVLDGPPDRLWVDHLNSLLDDNRKLCLSSGEVLFLTSNKKIIFEVDDLAQASPAMIPRCGIIYLKPITIGWKSLVTSWLQTTNFEWQKGFEDIIIILFSWIIPPCLEFITTCHQLCEVSDNSLVKTTIQVLEMLLNEAYETILRKEEDPKNLSSWIQASFIQAIIWGISANFDKNSRSKFDEFFKQLWRGQNKNHPYPTSLEKIEVSVPIEERIFDYSYLYKSKGNWKFWPDFLKNEKIEECGYVSDVFVPTNETIKYAVMINMHINYNYPLLLVGPSGTGKSSCMLNLIMNKLDKKLYEPGFFTFTAKTTPNQLQNMILSKLFKTKSGRYGPSEGKKCVLYIDDFSEPSRDKFGTQSTLELIRELLDQKKWYNLQNFKPLHIDNVNVFATMTSNSRNRNVSQRLLRHFNVFSINELPEESILRIFSNVLLTKWKKIGFPSDIIGTINQIVSATYHFYTSVSKLKPTLSWNFYYFNMRNFSRIMQVCAMIRKESADTNKKLFFKLWTYEIVRVLGDRLLDKNQTWLFDNIKFCISEYFKEDYVQLFENLPKGDNEEPDLSKILFGTYTDEKFGRFDETDLNKLEEIAVACVKDQQNTKNDLVLFGFALEQLAKICRIISIPCCNLIQVGMCGTGRQTLVKLACSIYNQKFFKLETREKYTKFDWHRTVKSFLKESGGHGRPCTFFLKEHEIVSDVIFEDLDYLLKTGQIPFLYSLEEKQEILDLVRDSMQEENATIDGGSESVFLYHEKRCKENLHVIISFNPVNSKFRKSLKIYPSLRKYCEIGYFKKWPSEALGSIAQAWTEKLDFDAEIKSRVVSSFNFFHNEAEKISNSVYITIGSFLEFVKLYVDLTVFKQKKITHIKERYLAALEKLSFAAFQISEMQKSLADYQPQLEAMTVQAIEMAKQIETETNEVEKASNLVKKDEAIANEQAAAAQVLKLDCEADLAQAIPILEDAISALNTLKPTDITLVKSMKNPPDAIKLVMAAVCVIKDVKPDRIPDPSTGRKTIDYWGPSKRILGDMNFLQTLKDFDKDNIKPEIMVKIRKDYLPHKDFKPHTVAKASSAAEGLCKWIIAMDMYDKVAKEVAPKKEKLEKAEREYGATMEILNEKKEQVSRIEQKLADLNAMLKEATRKQQRLQRDVDICKRKLNRAQKLIGGLSEEKIRWTNAVEELHQQYNRLPGDILLSSAIVAYLGPFRTNNRMKTLSAWINHVRENDIPFKDGYSIAAAFEKDVDFDKWHLNGLPTDPFFVENGIICKYSKRWSLCIDPQNQASNWIRINEKQNGIKVAKFSCPDYVNILKQCVSTGTPFLLQNVSETVEPFLMDLITRNLFVEDKTEYVNLGGHMVPYNNLFMLYMTTNLKYPKYNPEMYDIISIIDFGMNRESLENHLLTCVVEVEKPTLKKVKQTLKIERKRNKDSLYNIEERILKTLSESKTDILEDEHALQILDESKILSKEIQRKQEELAQTEGPLISFRSGYESVANHATNLYFTTYQLAKINHMYQFSYSWFIETYSESIQKAHKYKQLTERRKSLIETLTYELYCKICRSTFEKDKIFFAFLICTNLLLSAGKISEEEIQFLIKPTVVEKPDAGPEWLSQKLWEKVVSLTNVETFKNFKQFFIEHETIFQKISASRNPENEHFPEPYNSSFAKVLIISTIRPDRLFMSIRNFIKTELDDRFVNPPLFDVAISFIDSYILSPLIFIMKPGSEPVKALMDFAKSKNFHNKFVLMAAENGTEEEFEALVDKGKQLGLWICLQNCHLLSTWLPLLDLKLEEIDYSNTHENFRLWLTTSEISSFPISLLERSVKITKEPPQGLRKKMLNLFLENPINSSSFYTNCPGKHEVFIRLLYSVAFLHCMVLERKKFGCYGWNVPYGFNKDDFFVTIYELQNIINNRLNPLEEIKYLVERCSYGGYIADEMDRRLFGVIVRDYLDSKNKSNYCLPTKIDHQDCVQHILKLPELDDTEIFGLHENYESIREENESKFMLQAITTTFEVSAVTENRFDISKIIQELLLHVPEAFDFPLVYKLAEDDITELIVVQELKNYNELLKTIKTSLLDLQKVVDNSFLMTVESEHVCECLTTNKVPSNWLKISYENSYCLPKFMEDLNARIEYFRKFKYSSSHNIWLASFFKPKAFLVATKLFYSRKLSISASEIVFSLMNTGDNSENIDGIVVTGLFLIGASWNERNQSLEELSPKIIHVSMPAVLFVFTRDGDRFYNCPLYKCLDYCKEGASNYILSVLLSTQKCPDYWVRRGAALLCQA